MKKKFLIEGENVNKIFPPKPNMSKWLVARIKHEQINFTLLKKKKNSLKLSFLYLFKKAFKAISDLSA